VENSVANKMALWGTVRTGLLPRHLSATFYARINKRYGVLGRSFAGGYDSQGERSLYSQLVLLTDAYLRAYDNNPVLFARLLHSSGSWVLGTESPAELSELSLPSSTVNTYEYDQERPETDRILKAMKLHDRVGLTDASDSLAFMGSFLNSVDFQKRTRTSFSIGRRFFENAPFQISFYPGGDLQLEHELAEKQVYPIRLQPSRRPNQVGA
jgi:hypothetical protein